MVITEETEHIVRSHMREVNNPGKKKILILVPHQDDEILCAGNLILWQRKQGNEVFVCYATNGDYKCNAEIRMREAKESCKRLGIEKSHIIFLGYGDSLNGSGNIYNNADGMGIISYAGKSMTYGTKLFEDYSFKKTGCHNLYTKENFMNDIRSVLNDIWPDIVVCVDFDNHPDHRLLSILFDECIGEVLRQKPSYKPIVLKRFAYSLGYFANKDYTSINLSQTVIPGAHNYKEHEKQVIGESLYTWNNRIRIPAYDHNRLITGRRIYKALRRHVSQYAALRADRVINSDEIYWMKRTDNLIRFGQVSVSSGEAVYLTDFIFYNTKNIDQTEVAFDGYLWEPKQNDKSPAIRVLWDNEQNINCINLYGPIDDELKFEKIQIISDENDVTGLFEIEKRNRNFYVLRSNRIVRSKNLFLKFSRTGNWPIQIAQLEICPSAVQEMEGVCQPKILINDTFSEKYYVPKGDPGLYIGISCPDNADGYWIKVTKGSAAIDDTNKLMIRDKSKGHIELTLYREESECGSADIILCHKIRMHLMKIFDYIGMLLVQVDRIYFHIVNKTGMMDRNAGKN